MSPIFKRIANIAKSYLRSDEMQSAYDELNSELRKIIDELNNDSPKSENHRSGNSAEDFFADMPHDFSGTSSRPGSESTQNTINRETAKAFQILGISTNSTNEEIKFAFKKKIRQYHPDMQRNADSAAQAHAAAVTRDLISAYNILKKERNL